MSASDFLNTEQQQTGGDAMASSFDFLNAAPAPAGDPPAGDPPAGDPPAGGGVDAGFLAAITAEFEPSSEAAALGSQIADAEQAVVALAQKVAALDMQKGTAANARDFRAASQLSKALQLAKEEKAVKEMELGMLKAARSSPTAVAQTAGVDVEEVAAPGTPKVDSDSLAVWSAQDAASALPAGWELRPSAEYAGRSFYFHAASGASQWNAPTSAVAQLTTEGVPVAGTAGDASAATAVSLAKERELREAADARALTLGHELAALESQLREETARQLDSMEQEIVALESKLKEEGAASAELRRASQAVAVEADQEKAAAAAAAHQAGVQEGRSQMDVELQDLQQRVQAAAAVAEADFAQAMQAAQVEMAGIRKDVENEQKPRFKLAEEGEATAQGLRLELEAAQASGDASRDGDASGLLQLQQELASAKATLAQTQTDLEAANSTLRASEAAAAVADADAAQVMQDAQAASAAELQSAQASLAQMQTELEAAQAASAAAAAATASSPEIDVTQEYTESDSDDDDDEQYQPAQSEPVKQQADTGLQQELESAKATLAQMQTDFESTETAKKALQVEHDEMVLEQMKLKNQVQSLTVQLGEKNAAAAPAPEPAAVEAVPGLVLQLQLELSQSGPLGLKFRRSESGKTVVLGINPGSQAATHPSADQILPGLVLAAVAGLDMRGKDYKTVLAAVRSGARPLRLGFAAPDEDEKIEATFTEPGSLGLKLQPNKPTGQAEVMGMNAGTQAMQHPQITVGLFIDSIAGVSVTGQTYQGILGMIKKGGRPLSMTFVPGAQKPRLAAAAAKAGGSGGDAGMRVVIPRGDWELAKEREITTKLRSELQALTKKQDEGAGPEFSVTFTEPGSLGLRFTSNKHTGKPEVLGKNAGTQAEKHLQISVGAILTSIGGATVAGKSYTEVIAMIRAGGRPLQMTFLPAAPSVVSPRAEPSSLPANRELQDLATERARRETAESRSKALEDVTLRLREDLARADAKMQKQEAEFMVELEKAGRAMAAAAEKVAVARSPSPSPPPPSSPDAEVQTVSATFSEPGALGMRFGKRDEQIELVHINVGSQASRHPQLHAGLVVHTVRGVACAGLSYIEVLKMIKLPDRPHVITFSPAVSVVFVEQGSLGLKFTHNEETGSVEVLGINPGTQAENHPQVVPGLVLQSIGATIVKGTSYADVIALVKASGRPLAMSFVGGGTVASSPRGRAARSDGSKSPRSRERVDALRQARAARSASPPGMRVVVPRGDWKGTAAANAALKLQMDEEEEVARSPRAAASPRGAEFFTPPGTPTAARVDPAEVAKLVELQVAQARAKEKRAQEAYATEHSSHEATKSQLEALQQHTATASSGDSAKEAKYRAELDALSAELQRKEKSHSAELAAAAQLEQRWRDSVREAQRMRRELSPQAGPEEDSAEDGEVFVCYLCQKGVHNL